MFDQLLGGGITGQEEDDLLMLDKDEDMLIWIFFSSQVF